MTELIDLADLDVIYLSYDEPKADEFWARINSELPWAKRVHGVKGSDAAHKAAAAASDTERFVLIDGDNIPDWDFFNQSLRINDNNRGVVFRWRARNHINGLEYGNGGLSCWTQNFVQRMRTHEASTGDPSTDIEFCFDPDYWPMHDTWSTTYPNGSAKHAWRAGFREGVKMCLDRGIKPSLIDFETRVHNNNMRNLVIWQTVGRDVEHGSWAIMGARLGTHMTMLEDWDYAQVQDFDALQSVWEQYQHMNEEALEDLNQELHNELTRKLSLPIVEMPSESSKFFKEYQNTRRNIDIMLREGFEQKFYRECIND